MTDQTAQLLEELEAYIKDAQEMCDRGEFIALEGLDGRVQKITSNIQSLSVMQAREYADQLDAVGTKLDALQSLFVTKRDALGEELADTGKHHKAAKAYAQHEHATPKEG